jgi:Cu(I)/Ag(I) efflux system membrane fusion protein
MNKSIIAIAVVMLGVGVGIGYWGSNFSTSIHESSASTERKVLYYRNAMDPSITSPVPAKDNMGMDYVAVYAEEEKPTQREILFYRNPMNPDVISQIPMQDSMGMDYVPVYAEDSGTSDVAGMVKIDPVVVQNIGVRTAVAKKEALSRTVRAVGRVDFDEQLMVRLHPKVEGWIEEIRVDKTGQKINKNEILLSIYSPKLVSTQQEYLLAINNWETLKDSQFVDIRDGALDLVKSSRERLELLDVPAHQIKELESSHKIKKNLHIHSPVPGTVIRIGTRQGQYVTPATELYMIVDLRQVWVYADVYEYELPWVNEGDAVSMTLASVPGKTFKGTLAYIYPYAESQTRTTKVRIVFDNKEMLLRPDMFADVTIKSDRHKNSVVIPSEAVVRSGNRIQVFVVREPGKFEPRIVTLGIESNGQVAVLSGIEAGDEVVTSAQFLVDSESKLREATAKMMKSIKNEASKERDNNDKSEIEINHSASEANSTVTEDANGVHSHD